MRDLLPIALVTAAALGLVGAIVGPGHDTTILVSPPESVVEQFVRKLAGGRYDVARDHLYTDSPAMRDRIRSTSNQLRMRAGGISQIEGELEGLDANRARATAVITTERAGTITMEFELARRAGSWRIADF
jgi:hypothetical protein